MKIEVIGGEISTEEKQAYVDYVLKKFNSNTIQKLTVKLDGDFVDLKCDFADVPFQRIRRITGEHPQ